MPFPHSFPFPLGAFYSQTAPIGEKVNISKTISLKRKFLSFLGEINFILRNIGRHRSISALLGEHGSISRLIHVFRIKTSVLGILPLKNKLFHYARIVISKIGLLTQNISYTYFHLNRHTIMFFITHLGIKSIFSSIKHLLMGLNSRIGILSIQIRLDYSLHFISLNGIFLPPIISLP